MVSFEEQFQELIAQLIVRANKALKEDNKLPPIALLLKQDKAIEIMTTNHEDIGTALNVIQTNLQQKIKDSDYIASCISYPDYAAEVVVALLENRENFASELRIKVEVDEFPYLEVSKIEVNDGKIYIFPQSGASGS